MPPSATRIDSESVRTLSNRLVGLVRKLPGQPFRIHLNDGRAFDIRHQFMTIVGTTWVSIGIPETNQQDPVVDHSVIVDLSDVREIELLTASPSSN
jgi:hypothetical protein